MSDCRHNAPDRGLNTGDVQTKRQQLDEQDRERLLDQLIDCLYSIEGDTDTSAMNRCLEELEVAGVLCEDEFDVERGLRGFHEKFGTVSDEKKAVQKKTQVRRPMARIAIIAAALCACFAATAQASGFDLIGAIAKWTSEKFAFVKVDSEKTERQENSSDSLQNALKDNRIEERLAPTWFPEGSELFDLQIREKKGSTMISATYSLRGELIFISMQNIREIPYMEIEINNADVETYWAGGVEHHLMDDVKQRKVTWHNGTWECYIAGNLTREDMLLMIDSIYED